LTAPGAFAVVVILVVVALSAYAFALVLGGIGLRWRGYHNVLSSLAGTAVTILCGAYIPRSTLPDWAQALGEVLPATHGLEALRGALAGAAIDGVLRGVGAELLVGAAYLVLAELSFRFFLSRARSAGTLDFH
jgi:ABC-2 type transport system permease protein